jgi:hypothetical protein
MKAQKQFFSAMLPQLSPLGLIVIDYENRRLIQSNGPVQKACCISRDAFHYLLKEAFKGLLVEEDWQKFLNSFNRLNQAEIGEVVEMLCRTHTEDSTVKWVHFRSMVLEKDRQGKPLRTVCCGQDISSVKEVEQQMKQQVELIETLKDHGLDELKEPVASILNLIRMLETDKLSSQVDKLIIQYLHRTVVKLNEVLMKAA